MRPLLAAILLAGASPLAAQTVAITNGTVVVGDGSEPVQGATVVVRNGRIVAAGRGVTVPGGAEVIDATGKWVTPGIVAGFSRLGLAEVDLGADGSDDTDSGNGPFNAAIDVTPAINPKASTIAVSRADGVTRAIVAPVAGKNIFAGQGAVIDTGDDMTRAVEALGFEPAWVLVDGNATPRWQRPSKAIIAGDAKCRSIAAASIVAKVTRDRIMRRL